MHSLKITCVSENTVTKHSLLASHGQSMLIAIDDKKYLFDTGEIYEGLLYNLENLDIDLNSIDSVILSHNHLDHSGALFKLMTDMTHQKLLLPPDMITLEEHKYNTRYRTQETDSAIQELLHYSNALVVTESMKLDEDFYTTGPLNGSVKEQSLVMNIADKGLVLLVACSHPTLPVIVEKARQVTKIDQIYGIIGGLHYKNSNTEEIEKHITYIQSLNVEFIVPSHCTGYKAIEHVQSVLGEKVHVSFTGQFGTGNSLTILPELTFSIS